MTVMLMLSKKAKDMDVYIQGNKAEKEIYTQMNEKGQNRK